MRLLLIAILVGLTACHSGWDQDPFTGQDENVKNAVPPGGNKIKTPPVLAVMRLDLDSTYVMKEGQKKIIPIEYRLLHPDFKFLSVKIPNLESELPGAVYDENTRELVFEPEEGYVPTGGLMFTSIVRVSLFAEYEGLKQEIRKEIVFHVIRGSAEAPRVLSIDGIDSWMHEGTSDDFKIRVRDEVSPGGPVLVIQNPGVGWYNGAQFVTFNRTGRPVIGEPGVYEFSAQIDLTNGADLTDDSERFRFDVQAYSVLGVPSSSKTGEYRVYTNAANPDFSMENVDFTKGEKGSYSFTVFDPRKEGRVETKFVTDCSTLPGGANCSCRNISTTMSRCTLEWTPEQPGTFRVELESSNTVNKALSSELTSSAKKSFIIDVADVPGGEQ